MSANDPFKTLRDHRAALLACEAIGWLHMAGKAHPDFVKQQASDATNGATRDELKWATNVISKFGTLPSISTQAINPSDLFEKHRGGSDGVLGLLQAAHAMASGIEKNTPADYQKQPTAHTWLTTAFGYPVQNLLGTTSPAILAAGAWSSTETKVGVLIDALTARVQDPTNLDEWLTWRDGAIGPSGWLRAAFTSTLAETRVPNNDVTLWDQSFIAAALFKAAAAGAVLSGSSFEWGNGSKQSTRWRVLTVGIGAEHYEARAVRIGDWTGTRDAIASFFDEVSAFLDVDLAIGACVYRDERMLSFTFPGARFDSKCSVDDTLAETLRASIEAAVDKLAKTHAFETPPLMRLSPSTRSFISMSRELACARRVLEVPVHRAWSIASDGSRGKHVCPVTLVRAGEPSNNGSDRKQDVSKSAYDRRTGRHSAWEQSGGDTIWISEVADENDRVALLTFNLGLEGWLDGTHVDSLRAQSVVEWSQHTPLSKGVQTPTNHAELRALTEKALPKKGNEPAKIRAQLFGKLSAGFNEQEWPSPFYENIVEDRSDAPPWSSLDDATRAAWLTHQLFRKNASPGRVHRFWRTTMTFFDEALGTFRYIHRSDAGTAWRTRRLRLTLSGDTNSLREGDVYAGHLPAAPNAPFEILRRSSDFVTVCNLARVLGSDGDATKLKGMQFEASGDDGQRRRFTIDEASSAEGVLSSYRPLIVLEENPERFRVLVPLAAEAACVEHIITKWRDEMARVWDRLPLRVGVIGFPRKTPFQAVIEATRNVEDDLTVAGSERWRVTAVDAQSGTTTLSFEVAGKRREQVEMPSQLADGRDDVYFPNVAVVDAEREGRDFTAPRPDGASRVYRRAADLKPGDEVVVEPSRYASVFLDSTARRFEPVQVHPLSEWDRRRAIWEKVGKAAPSLTAARAVEQSLREARERWTDADGALDLDEAAWNDWVHAVLANEWNASGSDLQDLEQAARDGLLERVLSWHLHVLKPKQTQTIGVTS